MPLCKSPPPALHHVHSSHGDLSMNAWGKSLDADKKSGIRFLGDASGEFIRALDLEFPAAPMLGTNRSKRFAAITQDGKFVSVHVEPDSIGHDASSAAKVLG